MKTWLMNIYVRLDVMREKKSKNETYQMYLSTHRLVSLFIDTISWLFASLLLICLDRLNDRQRKKKKKRKTWSATHVLSIIIIIIIIIFSRYSYVGDYCQGNVPVIVYHQRVLVRRKISTGSANYSRCQMIVICLRVSIDRTRIDTNGLN